MLDRSARAMTLVITGVAAVLGVAAGVWLFYATV